LPDLFIDNVTKEFEETVALNNFSLKIKNGEAVVLLGPSGCGKTTLLKTIAGFLKPDQGQIRLGDKIVSDNHEILPPDKREMSMVFQSYAIWPHKTVFQNVAYGLEVRKVPKSELSERVHNALSMVQLDGLEHRYSTELSGGQQQRVALARAFVVDPSLLLLDEPLSNLDANLRVEMREELSDLHNRIGITFIYVTHDQEEAMVLGDRIVLMDHGLKVQEGTPEDLYERPVNTFAASFIGTSNIFSGDVIEESTDNSVVMKTDLGPITVQQQLANIKGKEGTFCIRPEWVKFHNNISTGAVNSFNVKVLKKQYYGKYSRYTVGINDKEISVETTFDSAVSIGDEISMEFPPQYCVCLRQ